MPSGCYLITWSVSRCHYIGFRVSLGLSCRRSISISIYFFHQNCFNVVFDFFIILMISGAPPAARPAAIFPLQLLTFLLLFPLKLRSQFPDNLFGNDHTDK
jgi:hypothetical protein